MLVILIKQINAIIFLFSFKIIASKIVENVMLSYLLFDNRDWPAGGEGVLSLFASNARTSRSQRFGERPKATTGTYFKMFLERSADCSMGCFLRSMSWMLGRAGL